MSARFSTGRVVATPGALEILDRARTGMEHLAYDYARDDLHFRAGGVMASVILARHITGDWGDICAEDKAANEAALVTGGRLLSQYGEDPDRLWVITEADRSVTTILRPDEY